MHGKNNSLTFKSKNKTDWFKAILNSLLGRLSDSRIRLFGVRKLQIGELEFP